MKGRKELLSRYKKRKEVSNDYVDDDGKEGREPVDKSVWETWLEAKKDSVTGKQSKDGKPASDPTYFEESKIGAGSELGGKGRAYSGGSTTTSVLSPEDLKYRTHDGRQGSIDFESPDHDEYDCPRCRQMRENTWRYGRERQRDEKIPKGGKSPLKKSKQYGKPLYGVTSLEKEGDGAGNTGVNSTDTVGVYNARHSDKDGRYKDQEKDTDKEGDEKDDGRRSRD
jgi:hypothetical protein